MDWSNRVRRFAAHRLPVKTVRSRLERPLASITFDDFPKSAWTVGGPILAEADARATYYTAGGFCGRTVDGIEYYDADDLAAVIRAGHEVGCHSYSHNMAPTLSSGALCVDADRNAQALRALTGASLGSYAYPYGEVSPRTKIAMGRRFASSRGIRAGVNSGRIDLAELRAVPLEARVWRPDLIRNAVKAAQDKVGWLILFTHDVSDHPSPYGCTPAMLGEALARIRDAGIEILPVKHAMARAVFSEPEEAGRVAPPAIDESASLPL